MSDPRVRAVLVNEIGKTAQAYLYGCVPMACLGVGLKLFLLGPAMSWWGATLTLWAPIVAFGALVLLAFLLTILVHLADGRRR